MSQRVKKAEELFDKGFVCSQAVFAAYSDLLGLDMDVALKIGNGFGGGIARRQEVCGAVTGALMAISMKCGKTRADDMVSHEKTYQKIDSFYKSFIQRNKSANCKEILGCDLVTAKEHGLFSVICKKCVVDAAEIVEEIFIEG